MIRASKALLSVVVMAICKKLKEYLIHFIGVFVLLLYAYRRRTLLRRSFEAPSIS